MVDEQAVACAVTMVRDDVFFLRRWVDHYADLFGHGHLYVVVQGAVPAIRDVTKRCNVIAVPDRMDRKFDLRRWRLLNALVSGLRAYYRWVVVGDVDEIVAVDPASGETLFDRLARLKGKRLLTPFGLEVVHRPTVERGAIEGPILGPRRHVQIAPKYAKPCLVGRSARLSRGGHYATHDRLEMPDDVYLFHLRYCDREVYSRTLDRRNAAVALTGATRPAEAMIGRHWFPEARDDAALFDGFDRREVIDAFDFAAQRQAMADSWAPRPQTPFWQFERPEDPRLYRLPDRFLGLF